MIYVYLPFNHCTVIVATNVDEGAQNLARNDAFIHAVKDILNEDREPLWYRHPPVE